MVRFPSGVASSSVWQNFCAAARSPALSFFDGIKVNCLLVWASTNQPVAGTAHIVSAVTDLATATLTKHSRSAETQTLSFSLSPFAVLVHVSAVFAHLST